MDYLTTVTFTDDRLGAMSGTKNRTKVTATTTIILWRMWEAHCDASSTTCL